VWGPAYDLKETFDNLRKYKMMLNPKKYVFSVSSGKLLGYRVPSWRINVNPKKVEAIAQLQPPQTRKNLEASTYDGSTQPIHIQVGRMWYVFLQATIKSRWIPVG
jgi:hypothetical protein